MRAILIDPQEQWIAEIDHPGTLPALYETIGCTIVEAVALVAGEALWVDEEGLLAVPHQPLFQIGTTTLAGRGVCLGFDSEGEIADSRLPLSMLKASVIFRPHLELKGWHHYDGSTTEETPFGPMPVFGKKPVFGPKGEAA